MGMVTGAFCGIEDAAYNAARDQPYSIDVSLRIACDLAQLFDNSLDQEQRSALLACKAYLAGEASQDQRLMHRPAISKKMDVLMRGSGDETVRLEAINRLVWLCLTQQKEVLDHHLASFMVEVAHDAGVQPEALVRILKAHMPNFVEPAA